MKAQRRQWIPGRSVGSGARKRHRVSRRYRMGVVLGAVAILATTLQLSAAAATGQVDLKVLVVSAGNRSEDVALELVARTMDNMGTPYDVVDATRQELTSAQLYADPTHGRYNGVILTISDLYTPSGSAFTAAEWQLLHDYERQFEVREGVLSGWPTWDPTLGLDYGANSVSAVGSASGQWVAPAGGTELFEYVNTSRPLDVTAFAFESVPTTDPARPTVTPLLVDAANPTNTLVSKLTYSDGRQVIYSSISNAWYFTHSYVLAYEFVNFATKGLFIGSRQVYLSVHTDDMFIEDEVWDPVNNTTNLANTYRMTAADVTATVNAQNQFRAAHPLAAGYTTQFPFNGFGAGNGTAMLPNETYPATADAEIRSTTCILIICTSVATRNLGANPSAVLERTTTRESSRYLIRFDDQLPRTSTISKATVTLNSNSLGTTRAARACRVTEDWTEGTGKTSPVTTTNVSWANRTGTTPWTTAGSTFTTANCVSFNLRYLGATTIDITSIWSQWAAGQPNYGIVIQATNGRTIPVSIVTREGAAAQAPKLTLTFATTPNDPLTAALVANKANFGFINHTYASLQMDRVCPDPDDPQPVPMCPVTNYLTARNDIARNRVVWQKLGLPGYTENLTYLLSDSHAGLHDRRSTEEDPSDDIPYPTGKNNNFFQAMQDLGVKNIASDSSRPNQDIEAYAPGYPVMATPRYPTAIWANSTNPAEDTDQYNWIFHDRFVAAGQDPCSIPAAVCTPKTWEQILAGEADLTLMHMLTYKKWPHYMHQINLRDYDGAGHSLQFDWLNAVMDRYEQVLKLPVVSLPAYQIGQLTERAAIARAANVRGTLDLATGQVTLVADGAAQPTVTGLAGGSLYGGQYQLSTSVSTSPQVFAVDLGLGV